MKQILLIIGLVVLVGCGKKEQAKATPDASANKLFVEAVQLITSAEEQTGEAAIKDYEQALAHLQNIISDYSESDLAVKLISGETLFTGKSLKEIKERVKELKREAASEVEKAIREELNKPTGELTEADLAKVIYLSLRFTKITDAGLKELAKLQKLKYLCLGSTKITDVGLKEIAKMQQLEVLSLDGTKITDVGLKEVAKMEKLERLYLSFCLKITDAGLKDLGKLQKLTGLSLNFCTKITDAGLTELAKMQQLEQLYLHDTKITKAGVAELQKALPKCDISGP